MKKETQKILTLPQIVNVVEQWYVNLQMNFQTINGFDLEEIVRRFNDKDYYKGNAIKEFNLSDDEVLLIVKRWYEAYLCLRGLVIFNVENIELNDYCTYLIVDLKINGQKKTNQK